MDFGLITAPISAALVVVAVLAGGKIRVVIGFAAWAARKVGRFFDDRVRGNR